MNQDVFSQDASLREAAVNLFALSFISLALSLVGINNGIVLFGKNLFYMHSFFWMMMISLTVGIAFFYSVLIGNINRLPKFMSIFLRYKESFVQSVLIVTIFRFIFISVGIFSDTDNARFAANIWFLGLDIWVIHSTGLIQSFIVLVKTLKAGKTIVSASNA